MKPEYRPYLKRATMILGWLFAVFLCLIYSLILSVYGSLLIFHDNLLISHSFLDVSFPFFPVVFAILVAVFTGCCLGVVLFCRKRDLDSRGYWRFGVMVLLVLPIAWLLRDASPIDNDYSLQDIVSHDQEILASYDTLMKLRKGNGLSVSTEIRKSDYHMMLTNAIMHSETINNAWDSILEVRSIVEKLDTYPGITDLTPQTPLGTNTPILSFVTLRSVAWTYQVYAGLKTAEGHPEEAARNLAKLHSVTRKGLPPSSILIHKMIWIAIAGNNMQAAFDIVRHPNCTRDALLLLKDAFYPLSEDDVSLRRTMIWEYVCLKSICECHLTPNKFLDVFVMSEAGKPAEPQRLFRRTASAIAYHMMFRKNRTFRELRKCFDFLIAGADKKPPDMSEAEIFMKNYCANPNIRNLGGWYLISIAVPSFGRGARTAIKTKVLSDLLYIEITKRLGETITIQDYYSERPYSLDEETGRMFSVGPDGKPHTDDDIAFKNKNGAKSRQSTINN